MKKKKIPLKELSSLMKKYSKEIFKSLKVGLDIVEIAEKFDKKIYNIKKCKPILPLSIEPGPFALNYSPNIKYIIGKNDIISFTLGLSSGSNNLKTAYTRYFTKKNDMAVCICTALNEACNEGLKSCGIDVRLIDIKNNIMEVLNSHEQSSIINLCGHCLDNVAKIVPNVDPIPSMYNFCRGKMKENEKYFIDVYGTNFSKNTSVVTNKFPTIYFINKPKNPREQRLLNDRVKKLKFHSSRKIYNWIKKEYNFSPLPARKIYENFPNFKSQSSQFLYEQKILNIIPAKTLKPTKKNEGICAHFGHSILITENGCKFLC
jgi:methionine aminopeptidase